MQKSLFLAALAAASLIASATLAHGPADGGDHSHGDHAAAPDAALSLPDPEASWQLGALTLAAPYSRATLPNAPVAGGFLTIANGSEADDRLIAASSAIAGRMEIHEMVMDGDVMAMRALEEGLPIRAGQTVALQPGGYHLMFMDLTGPLVEGETVDVTLTFEDAGQITVPLSIQAFNAGAAGHGAHDADAHADH